MAAIYSLLKHTSCPEFSLLPLPHGALRYAADLHCTVAVSFPSRRFDIYLFRAEGMVGLISASGVGSCAPLRIHREDDREKGKRKAM